MAKKLVLKRPTPEPEVKQRPDHLGPTERKWMSHKQKDQMFLVLDIMSESNNTAFNVLMEVFEQGADPLFNEISIILDDMNIRGEQIVIARASYATFDEFIVAIRERSPWLLDQINTRWKKAFMERAVPSGAHKWMHKKIMTPPPHG